MFQIDLNTKDRFGLTTFLLACSNGFLNIVEMFIDNLLEFDIELNSKDNGDNTVLHWTLDLNVAEILVQNHAVFNLDLNEKNNAGQTAFHSFCENSESSVAALLLRKSWEFDIDISMKYNQGKTALHYHSFWKNQRIVEIIKEYLDLLNFDLLASDSNGTTIFQIAEQFGETEVVNLLKRRLSNTLNF